MTDEKTTALRERAREIATNHYQRKSNTANFSALIDAITEALKDAYKQGAMSRVSGVNTDSQNTTLRELLWKAMADGMREWEANKVYMRHRCPSVLDFQMNNLEEILLAHGDAEFRRGAMSRVSRPSDDAEGYYDDENKIGKPYGLKRHDDICDEFEKWSGMTPERINDVSMGIWKGIESERNYCRDNQTITPLSATEILPSAGLLKLFFDEANEGDCSTGKGLWNCFSDILSDFVRAKLKGEK